MKRTTVVLDEKLLENARRVSGESTNGAAITKALEEYVRKRNFWDAYDKFYEEVKKGDFFWPGYLEELRPASRAVLTKTKARVSAHEKRVPRKTSRGSR